MNEATKQFKKELFELCRKHEVTMEVEIGPSHRPEVNFFAFTKFDSNGEGVRGKIDLTLGSYEDFREESSK